ncbi:MAG: cupin domain-containing protein [Comamonas sp.]
MNALDAGIAPVRSAQEFDALRQGWRALATQTRFVTRAGCPVVYAPGGPIYILLRGEQTAGQVGIYDQTAVAGSSVPLHHQSTEDETFYVLEGLWRFQAGAVVQEAGPGTLIHAPAHTSHAFGALAGPNDIARVLSWNAPAGHERFYIGMGDSAAKGERPDIVAAPRYRTVFSPEEAPTPVAEGTQGGALAPATALFTHFAQAPQITIDGLTVATLLNTEQSNQRQLIREVHCAAGQALSAFSDFGVGPRYFYVTAGEWEITVGDETRRCAAHTAVMADRAACLRARVVGTEEGRLLELNFGQPA